MQNLQNSNASNRQTEISNGDAKSAMEMQNQSQQMQSAIQPQQMRSATLQKKCEHQDFVTESPCNTAKKPNIAGTIWQHSTHNFFHTFHKPQENQQHTIETKRNKYGTNIYNKNNISVETLLTAHPARKPLKKGNNTTTTQQKNTNAFGRISQMIPPHSRHFNNNNKEVYMERDYSHSIKSVQKT